MCLRRGPLNCSPVKITSQSSLWLAFRPRGPAEGLIKLVLAIRVETLNSADVFFELAIFVRHNARETS